jgi:hypothetical protein
MAGTITTRQIPAGAVSKFQQATAPVNWNRITTYNDLTLRLVNTSNTIVTSAQSFSTVFTPTPQPFGATTLTVSPGSLGGPTTLTTAQIPPHTHSVASPPGYYRPPYTPHAFNSGPIAQVVNASPANAKTTDGGTYGGGCHAHPQSFSGPGSVPFSPGTINFAIKYIDLILCQRVI